MTTKYYVALSRWYSSDNMAMEDLQKEVQRYLDKGGNLQGGIVAYSQREDGNEIFKFAQAVTIEET